VRRREFIGLLGGAAAVWPLKARAQQATTPVIGFLNGASPEGFASQVKAFGEGLKESGYVEGQNVAIEYRWANDQFDRLPELVADLVRRPVSVISANTPANLVAKAATKTIPIVFTTGGDPVKLGLVERLDRPGGNVTGVTQLSEETAPKRLELLHELLPAVRVVAVLANPTNPGFNQRALEAAAAKLGFDLHILQATTEADFEGVFAKLSELKAGGLIIGPDTVFNNHTEQLAALALRHSVPAIYEYRRFPAAGGLAGYGGDINASYRLAGIYAGRILKGEKPGDLPVQQSTKVELIINMKTAKAFGITVPISILGRADEVIE
jgi:putative ABC transport system substrate-binding protein